MAELSVTELHRELLAGLIDVPEGDFLTALDHCLIAFGVAVSVTSLNRDAAIVCIAAAYAAGATTEQIQEVLSLVSGLGVHSLMISSTLIAAEARSRGALPSRGRNADEEALWEAHVGRDPFWAAFERELPGFLDSMLDLSRDQFIAFFDYCALPWKSGHVRAVTKELVALATDTTPAHRFAPGARIHLANALKLGAARRAIGETLAIAAAAPAHTGVS